MKFFTFREIMLSIAVSVISGILMGGVYSASGEIMTFLYKIFHIVGDSIKICSSLHIKTIKEIQKRSKNKKYGKIYRNVFESILFTIFGFIIILLYYAYLDGVYRLYVIAIIAFFFFISKNLCKKAFHLILKVPLDYIYTALTVILAIIIAPIRKILSLVGKATKALALPIQIYILKKRSDLLYKNKLSDATKL